MPSIISAAAGLMALSGLAVAFPQNGFTNTTSAGNTTSTGPVTATNGTMVSNSTASALSESAFCPQLSGSVIVSSTGAEFQLACATNHFGVVLDVQYGNSTVAKRAVVAPTNIQDCINACAAVTGCVGTAFDDAADTCTLFSEIGAAYTADGVDFAVLVSSGAATSATAGQTLTSTLYSTAVQTISSCAPTVTNCPLKSAAGAAAVVTEVVAVTSTDYICPTATVIPASPVACSACAYSASTVTVYSTTTVQGTIKVAAVSTTVIAVASPTGTTYSTSTMKGSGAAVTTAPMTVAASATATGSSGMYTGAASNVKAVMGLIAGAGALAAFVL
ncbi:hypothetical protein BDV97DRAFT_370099 [Delphinella strobiligena]|nr:hypothetical protein BDV97DRAFT_370099 [Delphinella strobiligena]